MYDEIRRFIIEESAKRKKTVAHFQALIHAEDIRDPKEFCEETGVESVFAKEVHKMQALARYMDEMGYRIVKKD